MDMAAVQTEQDRLFYATFPDARPSILSTQIEAEHARIFAPAELQPLPPAGDDDTGLAALLGNTSRYCSLSMNEIDQSLMSCCSCMPAPSGFVFCTESDSHYNGDPTPLSARTKDSDINSLIPIARSQPVRTEGLAVNVQE